MGGARRFVVDAADAREAIDAERAGAWRRLRTLALLLIVVYAASAHFIGIAQNPMYQVHSDDLTWMWRFVRTPHAALPLAGDAYSRMPFLPEPGKVLSEDLDYIYGMDQPALERWTFHGLLCFAGKLPQSLPAKDWDYTRDAAWNIENGNVAPPDAVHFVRVVNATFMILAAALIFVAFARSATAVAGLVAALYFVNHPATVETVWSIGPDPLLWMLLAATLVLWVYMGATLKGAIAVGIVAGLAVSTKLNAGAVLAGYALWLLLKRRPALAALAVILAAGVFVALNPIVFARGVTGAPSVAWEMLSWRRERAALMALNYGAFAYHPVIEWPRWTPSMGFAGNMVNIIFRNPATYPVTHRLTTGFYLLGPWWPLLPLVLVAPRLRTLAPAVFWAAALAVVHALTVTAPVARYKLPIEAGLVLGVIAAYWPERLRCAFKRGRQATAEEQAGREAEAPEEPVEPAREADS